MLNRSGHVSIGLKILRFCLLLDGDNSIEGAFRKLELVVEIRRRLAAMNIVSTQAACWLGTVARSMQIGRLRPDRGSKRSENGKYLVESRH